MTSLPPEHPRRPAVAVEPNEIIVPDLRRRFLEEAGALGPLKALAAAPLAAFHRWTAAMTAAGYVPISAYGRPDWAWFQSATDIADGAVLTSLTRWASRFNLNVAWVLDAAVETLISWRDVAGAPSAWAHALEMTEIHAADEAFVFTRRGWTPEMESWQDFSERTREAFSDALADYQRRIQAIAASAGLAKVKADRDGTGVAIRELAERVVLLRPVVEIVDNAGSDRLTEKLVYARTSRIARIIGMPIPLAVARSKAGIPE